MTAIFIPDPRLALPAPQIAGYLPAWASEPPVPQARPLAALKDDEEALLISAYQHRQSVPSCRWTDEDGRRWFPVSEPTRAAAAMLVEYGYFEKHPSKRRKMWYGLTADGEARAKGLVDTEMDTIPLHIRLELEEARQTWHLSGEAMRYLRRRSLAKLQQELAFQGYVLYHEGGRGPHLGEQAFYNVFTRDILLYRCRIGSDQWYLREGGYFKPDGSFVEVEQMALAIDF